MKPRLNLATAPFQNTRRFFSAALAVGLPALVLGGLLAGATYRDWRATRERRAEVSSLEAELSDFRHERADLERFFSSPETRLVTDRAAFLNGLIDQRSFPWTKMFMDLERLPPQGVRVVSLAPHLNGGHVELKMVISALSDKSKLEFLKTLEESPEFSHLLVVSESRSSAAEEAGRVQVELVTRYSGEEQ